MNRKYIFLLAANLIIYSSLFAQHKGYKSSIGLTFSPDYAYRTALSGDSANKIFKEFQSSPQNAVMGFTSGLAYRFNLFGTIGIETGVNYTRKGWGSDSVNSQAVVNNLFNYNYAVVPIKIRINLPSGRKLFYINAGVMGGVLLDAAKTVTTAYFNGTLSSNQTAIKSDLSNKIYYSMVFGFGLDYRLFSNVFFKIEPNYQRALSEYSAESLKSILSSTGVNLGLVVGLK